MDDSSQYIIISFNFWFLFETETWAEDGRTDRLEDIQKYSIHGQLLKRKYGASVSSMRYKSEIEYLLTYRTTHNLSLEIKNYPKK